MKTARSAQIRTAIEEIEGLNLDFRTFVFMIGLKVGMDVTFGEILPVAEEIAEERRAR